MRPPERRRPAGAPAVAVHDVAIGQLGSGGDGAGKLADGSLIHVPGTLPGEVVRVATGGGKTRLVSILDISPDRVSPPCPQFGVCGGCALQHWADAPYAAWKRERLRGALARAGYPAAPVAELQRTAPGTRRRMEFAVLRIPHGVRLGLHEAGGKDVVDIGQCTVLHPDLQALLAPLRGALTGLAGLRRSADVLVNLLESGPDILVRADAEPAMTDRAKLADFARAHGIARIAWAVGAGEPENVALIANPVMRFAGVAVTPPPGAFLQASEAGERAIVDAVIAGLPVVLNRKTKIIELYAGVGTLSFALAKHGAVAAYEGQPAAHAALARAAGGTRVQAVLRDLARQPLQVKEFAGATTVVLDPPYAGAATQMVTLAAAGVKTVIYVSCNPVALARDAAVLLAAGYAVVAAVPIDQFLWSAQVEAVVTFRKG